MLFDFQVRSMRKLHCLKQRCLFRSVNLNKLYPSCKCYINRLDAFFELSSNFGFGTNRIGFLLGITSTIKLFHRVCRYDGICIFGTLDKE